jgi:cell division protein FtsI (penicillin-binding protein 3)
MRGSFNIQILYKKIYKALGIDESLYKESLDNGYPLNSQTEPSTWYNIIRAITTNSTNIDTSQNRLHVVVIMFGLAFTILSLRVLSIAVMPEDHITKRVAASSDSTTLMVHRGNILDRNDTLLAVNLSTASLYANPKIILDPKEAADKLHRVFPELKYNQLLTDLSSSKNFIWIKRNLTPKEQYEVNNLGIPGLMFEKAEKRVYPHGTLLSHVLGFVGIDGKGLAGIEQYFDKELIGDPESGKLYPSSVQLSIDVRIQNILYEELDSAVQEFKAIGAVGVVADVKNGEILGSVSLPSFDPNTVSQANSEQMFNRFSLALNEPGSTAKTFTIAMALDNNITKLSDTYDVSSPIQAARFRIHDFKSKGDVLSVPEIFMYSSNIGTAKIGLQLGKNKQKHFLKSLGLMDPLSIELPEKASPMYPSDARWSDISTMTISYGHGIAVTPLHVVQAMIPIVNGGTFTPLTYVKRDSSAPVGHRVFKQSTSEQMRKLLRLTVERGSGKKANVEGYLVGGKTGTAEKIKKGGGYAKNNRVSSFIASFPIHDPKYIILVVLDEPKGNQSTGGWATAGVTAAPTTGKITSRIATLLGIPAVDENSPEVKQKLDIDPRYFINDTNHSF